MEISTVPTHYVNTLLRAAQQHGLNPEQVLHGAHIDSALIAGDRTRVSSASFRQLAKYLMVELQDENAGLLAHRTKRGSFAMMCYAAILLSGIGTIVYAYEDVMGGGTNCEKSMLAPLYRERTVEIIPHIKRDESLALFKTFFGNNRNNYWENSLRNE